MQRRKFLQTIGGAAPAALAGSTASLGSTGGVNGLRHETDEPRVFLFDDGRHAGPLYQFAPPLKPEDHTYTVDQLVGSGVDTLVYFAGLEGGVALYDSRVSQKWGDNVTRWSHPVFYRAARHIHHLIDEGYDPLELLCTRCHEKGIWFIASNWVTLLGGERAVDGGAGRKSDFVYDHPQFQVGPDRDPRSRHVPAARFSFLHEEFRRERLAVFEELLARYETDGVELNLAAFVPYCRFDQVSELAPRLTAWLVKLRKAARKAEQAQSRRKRIYVRIPASADAWKALGYEVPAWVAEELVDGLVCLPGLMEDSMDQAPDLSHAVELCREAPCRVLSACSDLLGRQLERAATPPMLWAAAAYAYAEGADGFGIADYHWTPNGWPWTDEDYQTLRLLAHPDLLDTADKHYRVRSAQRNSPSHDWLPGTSPSLPQRLEEGRPVEVALHVADDVARHHAAGRVESVVLRVRITNLEPSLNTVRIELGGRPLDETMLQHDDLTYRLYKLGALNPYGSVYEYTLTPDFFPKRGRNPVTVTLVRRDRDIDAQFELYDVDCFIKYRLHRDFQPSPVHY